MSITNFSNKVVDYIFKNHNYIFRGYKRTFQFLKPRDKKTQNKLLIFGCQRSGTTLLTRIFDRDINTKVYGEFSDISPMIRLKPLSEITREFQRQNTSFIITKPIVESQNAAQLLDSIKDSKVLWIYRNFHDVLRSNLHKFGKTNGIDDLEKVLHSEPNWRSEKVSDQTRAILEKYYAEDMDQNDSAALFWYSRNILYFEQELDTDPKSILMFYDDMVREPKQYIGALYQFCDHQYPGEKIHREVRETSIGKGKSITVSPPIESLCSDLLDRLNASYKSAENIERLNFK